MTNGRRRENDVEVEQFNSILELVVFAKNDTLKSYHEVKLGTFRNQAAQQICRTTGVPVLGVVRKLTAHGIRHAFNGHGNDALEAPRGQVGIVDTDFELLPEILNNPDSYTRGDNSKKGQDAIVFTKKIGYRTYHVIMSITKSKGIIELTFNTMYIKK